VTADNRAAVDAVKARLNDVDDVIQLLDLVVERREGGRVWILCPWHSERTASCSLQVRRGVLLAHCFGCSVGGDVLALVAASHGLDIKRDFPRVLEQGARLANVDINRLQSAPPAPRRAPRPPELGFPPVDEVRALWDACTPVSDDAAVAEWIRDARGLIPKAVDCYGLARALPQAAVVPRWARYRGSAEHARSWPDLGYRAIVPMYDEAGELRSVRARAIVQPPNKEPKVVPPRGFAAKGLLMMDPLAKIVFATGCWPWDSRRVVAVAEGEPDFLTLASQGTGARADAVIGISGSGAWTNALAARIPDGSTIAIWTDNDSAGDAYADEIAASLGARCDVRESFHDERQARRTTTTKRRTA
jgi:CHC2-type zinc finger protein/Toprim domain-containing protein